MLPLSARARVAVRPIEDTEFDLATIIGRGFDDTDGDGRLDRGEKGMGGGMGGRGRRRGARGYCLGVGVTMGKARVEAARMAVVSRKVKGMALLSGSAVVVGAVAMAGVAAVSLGADSRLSTKKRERATAVESNSRATGMHAPTALLWAPSAIQSP